MVMYYQCLKRDMVVVTIRQLMPRINVGSATLIRALHICAACIQMVKISSSSNTKSWTMSRSQVTFCHVILFNQVSRGMKSTYFQTDCIFGVSAIWTIEYRCINGGG